MDIDDLHRELWGEVEQSVFPYCVSGRRFFTWADALCKALEEKPDITGVYQAKLLLLDRYFSYRSSVPKPCRYRVSETGHRCIWHVFSEIYGRLHVVQLSLTPPLFLPPSPPPPPPQLKLASIGLGILEEE